jgi:hypothetical protein
MSGDESATSVGYAGLPAGAGRDSRRSTVPTMPTKSTMFTMLETSRKLIEVTVRRRARAACAAWALAVVSGCSLTLNTDSLTSGPAREMTDGTTQPAADAALPEHDAAADGGMRDSNPDAGAATWCEELEEAPELCSDFDGAEPFAGWTPNLTSHKADAVVLSADDADAQSPSQSLLAVVRDGDKIGEYIASSYKRFLPAGKPVHIEIDFALNVEKTDPVLEAKLMPLQIVFGDRSEGWYGQITLVLVSKKDGVALRFGERSVQVDPDDDNDQTVEETVLVDNPSEEHMLPALGTWLHVQLEVDAQDAGDSRAKLSVDDASLLDTALDLKIEVLKPAVEIGAPWVDTSTHVTGEWRVRYDNVLLRVDSL